MWRQIEIGSGRVLPRILTPALGLMLLGFSFAPVEAQYFGRNKVQYEKPLLCDGDGPIALFRRWCTQFYSWPEDQEAAE